jgi:hypothetical protein
VNLKSNFAIQEREIDEALKHDHRKIKLKTSGLHLGRMSVPAITSGVDEIVLVFHVIGLFRTSTAVDVRDRLDLLALNLVQEGREDPPGLGKLVGADEVHLGADEDVQDEAFVGVRQSCLLVPRVVGQVELGFFHVEADARSFGHYLRVYGLSRLNGINKFVLKVTF